MFPGSPSQLRPTLPLRALIDLARPGELLGAWVRASRKTCRVRTSIRPGCILLAASDLGYLLHRCTRVAVWDHGLIALESTRLIRCRVLQIVLGTPFLPPPDLLRALYPSLRVFDRNIAVPIGLGSAEEALSLCAAHRMNVVGSRIEYLAISG